MQTIYATHVSKLTQEIPHGSYAKLSFIVQTEQGSDNYFEAGSMAPAMEAKQLIDAGTLIPLREPQLMEEGMTLIANCVGGIYYVNEQAFDHREPMKSIGTLLCTSKKVLCSKQPVE